MLLNQHRLLLLLQRSQTSASTCCSRRRGQPCLLLLLLLLLEQQLLRCRQRHSATGARRRARNRASGSASGSARCRCRRLRLLQLLLRGGNTSRSADRAGRCCTATRSGGRSDGGGGGLARSRHTRGLPATGGHLQGAAPGRCCCGGELLLQSRGGHTRCSRLLHGLLLWRTAPADSCRITAADGAARPAPWLAPSERPQPRPPVSQQSPVPVRRARQALRRCRPCAAATD